MTAESEKLHLPPSKQISALRRALPQVLAVGVKNVLLLGFGMTLGFPTILIPNLSGGDPEEKIVLGQEAISWIGSVNYLCVPLGCILSGILTQPLGRRRAMQIVNLPFVAAWLLFHFSTEAWQIFLALCITGFSGGLLEAPVLTYVAEITEPSLRGALSSTSTMSINLGILISFLLGTFLHWRTMALVNSFIPFIALLLLFFVPESPYWLISRKRLKTARRSLAWLRGWTSVESIEEEFLMICDNLENNPLCRKTRGRIVNIESLKLYLKPSFLKPYILITLTFVIGHFGNTPITTYAIKIFTLMKVPVNSYYATVSVGALQLLGVTICVFSIKYLGKRLLVFISLTGVFACFLLSGVYSYTIGANNFSESNLHPLIESYTWIPLLTLLCQAFFSYLCIKGLPWILVGELYNNDVRAFASGLTAGTGYVFGFLSNKIFPNLVDLATLSGVFWLYSGVAVMGLILLYFWLPETEGKSLAQITNHYAGGTKLGNKVLKSEGKKDTGMVNKGFEEEGNNKVVETRM